MRYEWDKSKAQANLRKHGVGFPEAQTVFGGAWVGSIDAEHSLGEDRDTAIGMSDKARILRVSFTYRENKDVIRIISARLAGPDEIKTYLSYV